MPKREIEVAALRHKDKRRNIPTAELEPVMDEKDKTPIRLAYERRNRDLDPQLVWRGKDEQDWSDLIVQAPPLYIQEKVHPKVLVDDLLRQSKARAKETTPPMPDLFADFNGLPDREALTEFYQHDANWSNRMISGDSLSVMASLAEREGLRGKVQCIYIDPPYGIRFNSNFQWSTTSRDVKDGNKDHITREPEQVQAFRDTWRDGIHSYLTYLRDRLTVARDLLADSGSIFVQIGDENVHRVRALMDEVFGDKNYVVTLSVQKTGSQYGEFVQSNFDAVLWYTKEIEVAAGKFRALFQPREGSSSDADSLDREDYSAYPLTSDGPRETTTVPFQFEGRAFHPGNLSHWKVTTDGLARVGRAGRIIRQRNQIRLKYFFEDYPVTRLGSTWMDIGGATGKIYVVQTTPKLIERCILMTTDPGDLVLDPTCGSGTMAYVAEQWGRRWITIDTSRVALALARARIMGARYPYYLLADSPGGQRKESEVTRTPPKETPTHADIRQGFVYERVPHITLKSIANNAEIDVIWEKWQETLEKLRSRLNAALARNLSAVTGGSPHPNPPPLAGEGEKPAAAPNMRGNENAGAAAAHPPPQAGEGGVGASSGGAAWREWEIPREAGEEWPGDAQTLHAEWWAARIARQKEIDASIAAKAEFEYLYDKPYPDNSRIRVAGPFTVESLSPHRVVAVDQDDSLIHEIAEPGASWEDFGQMVLDHLKTAGVQQAHKEDRITFTALTPWPGKLISAEGRYSEGPRPHPSLPRLRGREGWGLSASAAPRS